MKKKILALFFVASIAVGAAWGRGAPAADPENFPTRSVNGIIQWGAGGGTDLLMRPLASIAEGYLGASIVVRNMPGATGSIAFHYVYDQPADGYNLLMGAENPALYTALGISNLTYEDFEPILIIGDESVGIIVRADSPFQTLTQLINAALASPGTVTLGTSGRGGVPWVVGAFITSATGAVFNQIPYESDGAILAALMAGEIDFSVVAIPAGLESHLAGTMRYIAMMTTTPPPALPDVPLAITEFPAFERYLPWGMFRGVFVRNGTDQRVIDRLSAAFLSAAQSPAYQEFLATRHVNFLGYTGAQARAYVRNWQLSTVGALESSGALD
ncbi:MAG: tripartite tricarboxylate transporter substrate binding protein [Spirochaetes bacterium]|nr:tripartite tricarboxylate transporter substrate binding protein [Spirochaetota bacterium]